MKKFKTTIKIILASFFILLFQPSCNLDEDVYSDITGEALFSNPDNLIFAFGTAYTNFYQLAGHKFGLIGMDAGTDILCVPQRGGDWFDGGEWHRWHRLTWLPSEGYIERWWNILYKGISSINELIPQFQGLEDVDTEPAIAELRALRALYYWWLLDIYGNVPLIAPDVIPYVENTGNNTNAEQGRKDVYNFVESELLAALPYLSKETGFEYYGRINYYVANMILSKLYINAEVYTGTAQWDKALTACDTVIESGIYSLAPDFFDNFQEDASGCPEVMLGVPYDQVNAQGFEIHLFTLHYNLTDKYGIEESAWNGLSAQEAFFNSFDSTDLRRNGLLFGQQYDNEGNKIEDPSFERFDPQNPQSPKDPDGAPLNLTPEINMLEPNCLRQAGARIAKWPFIEGSNRYTSNDFPIFRYADVLLMKAEVLLRNGGDAGTALSLVNEVRQRAGIADLTSVTLDDILAERARELYAEGYRRSDLIRFGKYLGTRWEKDDVSPDYVKIWPIPESQMNANPNLTQNPGY
ncbi:MAG: RagB/SusD family nutrient uptake outer membrane protein [Chlorobi bacterium]|nr:RagB/SusD family nutrient uptake outer membrane protein [Chlorobiota bacterium]